MWIAALQIYIQAIHNLLQRVCILISWSFKCGAQYCIQVYVNCLWVWPPIMIPPGCLASMFDNKYPSITVMSQFWCNHVRLSSTCVCEKPTYVLWSNYCVLLLFNIKIRKVLRNKMTLLMPFPLQQREEEEKWNIFKLDLTKLFLCG